MKELESVASPQEAGFRPSGVERAFRVLEEAIAEGAFPGAVTAAGRKGRLAFVNSFGRLDYEPHSDPVSLATIYDLASLTKVVVTTTLSMILVDRGALALDKPVRDYLPAFRGGPRDRVAVIDLLAHCSGLPAWKDLYRRVARSDPRRAREEYVRAIAAYPLEYPPRSRAVYSDLGIILIGEILERVGGCGLAELAREEIFSPLGMSETFYNPPSDLRPRIAPTEIDPWRGRLLRGEVHDENAFALGGVAPHAGLFSTAADLAVFAQMMLNGGGYAGRRLIQAATVARFTRRAELVPGSSRALGWDTPEEGSSAGRHFSASSYGHLGFTGTSLWIDPERELFVILLTNRVHPTRENDTIRPLRPVFHDAVIEALEPAGVPGS